jgi:hypothetical protein
VGGCGGARSFSIIQTGKVNEPLGEPRWCGRTRAFACECFTGTIELVTRMVRGIRRARACGGALCRRMP